MQIEKDQVAEALYYFVNKINNLEHRSDKIVHIISLFRILLEQSDFVMSHCKFRKIILNKAIEFFEQNCDNELTNVSFEILKKYNFPPEEHDGYESEEHYDHSGEV